MTSIIVTYHNEGEAFLRDCLTSLTDTLHCDCEIIVVDDCSDVPVRAGVKVLRNSVNIGVGRSFDRGVREASGDDIILMADDIRFEDNGWAERLAEDIRRNPQSIICTKCINYDNHASYGTGASLYLRHDRQSDPSRPPGFRDILNTKWLVSQSAGIIEVPCVLGAIYGIRKEWYNYIDGWHGFRKWGCLEPYISLKSWLMGGNCLCDCSVKTYHIFKQKHPHGTSVSTVQSNKIRIARMLSIDGVEEFLPVCELTEKAKRICDEDASDILGKKKEYAAKIIPAAGRAREEYIETIIREKAL